MTQMIAATALTSTPAFGLSGYVNRAPFIVRLVAAYSEHRSIKSLSADQLADVGMSVAQRNAITLADVFAKARG